MTMRSPMHQQIDTLPELVLQIAGTFDASARATFDFELCKSVKRIYLVGCGDSYHASYGAELAFHQLAGVSTQALSALTFSRYTVGYLPDTGPKTTLVLAVSVSGVVSRTIEALQLAQKAGAVGVALTGAPDKSLAQSAAKVFETTVPPLPDELNMVVPGVRSYLASQIALYMAALRIGEVRGHITTAAADNRRADLRGLADIMEKTIQTFEPLCKELVQRWQNAGEFVFVGGGPLFGAAMFSAAKILEASGDSAIAQETEEWTHIQYFGAAPATPTILLSANGFDAERMAEAARAAQSIGCEVVAVVPAGEKAISQYARTVLEVPGTIAECFAPVVYSIPGEIIAAEQAAAVNAKYFRDFGGGRTVDWAASGASQIRNSHIVQDVRR